MIPRNQSDWNFNKNTSKILSCVTFAHDIYETIFENLLVLKTKTMPGLLCENLFILSGIQEKYHVMLE